MTGQLFLACLEQDNCTRWRQHLRTLRRLDDNNAAVIYCGCSRNSEFGMTGWRQTVAVERRYKSELRGQRQMRSLCRKCLRCLAFSCLAHRHRVAVRWLSSATLQHSHILSQMFSLPPSSLGCITQVCQHDR